MDELPQVFQELAGRFEERADVPATAMSLDEVKQFVRMHVERLLESNPGMLMSILYRVDVPEAHVQEVLQLARHDEIADRLSDLIVTRQLQKVQLRRKYGDGDTR